MTQYIIVPKTKSTFKCGMQLRDWKQKKMPCTCGTIETLTKKHFSMLLNLK